MKNKIIGQGAEATIYLEENQVIKERKIKTYRIKQIDDKLRKARTKREAKVIRTLKKAGLVVPEIILVDEKDMKITMSYLKGPKVRDIIEEKGKFREYANKIGKTIGLMHNQGIIHQDLTTSNMILVNSEIGLIDFGLSFYSNKIEDRAVDLHLLERGLEAKHPKIHNICWKLIKEGYSITAENSKEVFTRLEKVEKRGRYKGSKS